MSTRMIKENQQSSTKAFDLNTNETNLRKQIAEKAHELWERRGWAHGRDVEDWLQAEAMILGKFKVKNNNASVKKTKGRVLGILDTKHRSSLDKTG